MAPAGDAPRSTATSPEEASVFDEEELQNLEAAVQRGTRMLHTAASYLNPTSDDSPTARTEPENVTNTNPSDLPEHSSATQHANQGSFSPQAAGATSSSSFTRRFSHMEPGEHVVERPEEPGFDKYGLTLRNRVAAGRVTNVSPEDLLADDAAMSATLAARSSYKMGSHMELGEYTAPGPDFPGFDEHGTTLRWRVANGFVSGIHPAALLVDDLHVFGTLAARSLRRRNLPPFLEQDKGEMYFRMPPTAPGTPNVSSQELQHNRVRLETFGMKYDASCMRSLARNMRTQALLVESGAKILAKKAHAAEIAHLRNVLDEVV